MERISNFFMRKATDIYAYVAMARVAIYAYVVYVNQLWEVMGWWFTVGVFMLIVSAVLGSTTKPGLPTTGMTLVASVIWAVLTHLSILGIDSVSASLFVTFFMTSDGLCAFFILAMLGSRLKPVSAE